MRERLSMKHTARFIRSQRQGMVAAVVLGTALSALGTAPARAEGTSRAVSDISRYCTACWRNARLHPDCWTDCTQEVFTRLLERVAPESWGTILRGEGEERREFLRAIDAVKKRTQRARKAAVTLSEDLVADRRGVHERRKAGDREAVRQAAAELLSPRQQRILQLSLEGWSVQEIAAQFGLAAERVSDEKYKAVRKLRRHLAPLDQG
jgi:RNA polymerase sigma factor (sigma-70 family)